MSTRNDILNAIRTKILTIGEPTVHADRVRIGVLTPKLVRTDAPVVSIFPSDETGQWEDGDEIRRTMEITVAVLIRIDPGSALTQQEQMNALYDQVHDKLEALIDAPPTGVMKIEENPQGIEWGGYDDGDMVAYVGSQWTIVYIRTRGQS